MKVMVLGGSGVMGSAATRDLVKNELFKEVVVASRRSKKENLHPKLAQNDKVSVKNVDVNNYELLVEEIKKYDVIINCVGPYYSVGFKVVKAAIEAKVNYVDIDDDYDAVKLMLDPTLDAEAKKAGVTILFGLGTDPGTGNLIAKYGAEKLDSVEEVELFWVLSIADCEGDAVWEHILHMNTGEVPQFINGKLVNVLAGSESEKVNFIEPFGPCNVHFVGHPEPLTLPKYLKGVKRVVNKGGMLPDWVNESVKMQAEWGFTSTKPIKVNDFEIAPRKIALKLKKDSPPNKDYGNLTSAARTLVKGYRDGKKVTLAYDIAGKMGPGTGIPAAIGAQLIASGVIKEKGVLPPEACISAGRFLEEFKKRGAKIFETEYVESIV